MSKLRPEAIFLDFFGTVVEEIQLPVRTICDSVLTVAPEGVSDTDVVGYWVKNFTELCNQSFGSSFRYQRDLEAESLGAALRHFNIPMDAFELSRELTNYRAHPTLFPESQSVLARCEIPIYLVTNIDNTEIQSAVRYCNLNFTGTVTSEDCRAYKPRREVFDKALALCGLQPAEVLHVGDSWHTDIQGAKAAGIPVLWIDRRKRPLPDSSIKPDYTASDLNGLLDVLLNY